MLKVNKKSLSVVVNMMAAEQGVKSLAAIADMLDIKDITFRQSINRQSMKVVTFIEMADKLGYDVVLVKRDSDG